MMGLNVQQIAQQAEQAASEAIPHDGNSIIERDYDFQLRPGGD
ncbi:MAG: hypothetical protein R3B91_04940 [Planctomycetaceae bacterium]